MHRLHSAFGLSRPASSPQTPDVCCVTPLHIHHTCPRSHFFFFQILSISVFLASMPCLDSHCRGRRCHITNRWITRGWSMQHVWAVSFFFETTNTQTRTNVQRFWHYRTPEHTVIMKVIPTGIPVYQTLLHMQNVLLWRVPVRWNPMEKGIWRATLTHLAKTQPMNYLCCDWHAHTETFSSLTHPSPASAVSDPRHNVALVACWHAIKRRTEALFKYFITQAKERQDPRTVSVLERERELRHVFLCMKEWVTEECERV